LIVLVFKEYFDDLMLLLQVVIYQFCIMKLIMNILITYFLDFWTFKNIIFVVFDFKKTHQTKFYQSFLLINPISNIFSKYLQLQGL
jgi:hypothetical protein